MDFNDKQDDFWDLSEYAKKRTVSSPQKQFPKSAVSAVEINDNFTVSSQSSYSDSKLSQEESAITRFIPPHSDPTFAKKYIISEYCPENPLIKCVKVCSEKPDDTVFAQNNLFIRERRALLNRKSTECPHASYYSYSPRYSQMSRAQLNWYLWWRENTRNGVFLKTDESYVILYAYELVTAGDDEDKNAAADMLCAILKNYTEKDINIVFLMMIRDLLCDFCLVHGIRPPMHILSTLSPKILANAPIPEFFLDFSSCKPEFGAKICLSSLSMYDFKRSKIFTPESADSIKRIMNEAMTAVIATPAAFQAMTSFVAGMYSKVTVERKPFARMINIVNKNVRLEIDYFQASLLKGVVTDAVRYSENKLREHLGIKNKLHIMAVNPSVKEAIDSFFAEFYPALPTIDRRRKNHGIEETEKHDYDLLYDVPKAEISPERAMEIERDSWSTTKVLTEAFADGNTEDIDSPAAPSVTIEVPIMQAEEEKAPDNREAQAFTFTDTSMPQNAGSNGLLADLRAAIGNLADFLELCKTASPLEQRRFASSHSMSLDEIADTINESACDIFGDIIIEDAGGFYTVIEEYTDQI